MYKTIAIVLILLLAACDQQSDDETLPTRVPEQPTQQAPVATATITEVPLTPTPIVRMTLPPTWTPSSTPTDLPPTNTPTFVPTVEIIPNELPEACNLFAVDIENSVERFNLGESPTVAWTAVEGAALYRVLVFTQTGTQIYHRLFEETTTDIPTSIFPGEGNYGWESIPLDPAGVQMCYSVGGVLRAED
jgi:hypothetical protein